VRTALEAEVAALRAQLSDQAEGHQSDMSALRAEQALRRAALEDALRAEAAESERRLCLQVRARVRPRLPHVARSRRSHRCLSPAPAPQFAEEATAFKVQADVSLQHAESNSRAARRREMAVLRAPVRAAPAPLVAAASV